MAPTADSGKTDTRSRSDSEVALKWWHLLSALFLFAVGLGQAQVSIAGIEKNLEELNQSVRAHVELPGHPIEMERVTQLRAEQGAVIETLRQINERLARIEANQIRLCQKQGVTCRE